MLKINKLKKRKQFNYLFAHGEHKGAKLVTLFFIKTNTKSYKLGFSVSKKVGNAVVRNKTKRRMKEILRPLSLKTGYYYILVAKPEIKDAEFLEIKQNILFVLEKNGFINSYEQ